MATLKQRLEKLEVENKKGKQPGGLFFVNLDYSNLNDPARKDAYIIFTPVSSDDDLNQKNRKIYESFIQS